MYVFYEEDILYRKEDFWKNSTVFIEAEPDSDQEEVELSILREIWFFESYDDMFEDFDIWEHFGIPGYLEEWQQENMLEAMVGSS
jgi:hypothetical protein